MSESARNRSRAFELTEADIDAALERMRERNARLAFSAEHVVDALTGGEGPAAMCQSRLQEWLWYAVPTKYASHDIAFMDGFAEVAAVLFDELGLHGYAAICRSEQTAKVFDAFEQSDRKGRTALRKAIEKSGIEAPDLDDFEWSSVMGTEEVRARSAVQAALEEAIYSGEMTVGVRGWRNTQAIVCREVIDGDHPEIPGQSWRTAVVTERVEHWVSAPERESPTLAEARAAIANRLLHPIELPDDAPAALRPLMWLLEQWGDEQPLTQAGYLKPAFVQALQRDRPWAGPLPSEGPVIAELDDYVLMDLREWLQGVGALRKYKMTLRRTPLGREMATDLASAWRVLTHNLAIGGRWERFVAETGLLFLLDKKEPIPADAPLEYIEGRAVEMGWQIMSHGVPRPPSRQDVSWSFIDSSLVWQPCRLIAMSGDYSNRQTVLTEVGRSAALSYLHNLAAGPKDSMW